MHYKSMNQPNKQAECCPKCEMMPTCMTCPCHLPQPQPQWEERLIGTMIAFEEMTAPEDKPKKRPFVIIDLIRDTIESETTRAREEAFAEVAKGLPEEEGEEDGNVEWRKGHNWYRTAVLALIATKK